MRYNKISPNSILNQKLNRSCKENGVQVEEALYLHHVLVREREVVACQTVVVISVQCEAIQNRVLLCQSDIDPYLFYCGVRQKRVIVDPVKIKLL